MEFEGPRFSQLRIILRTALCTAHNKVFRIKNVKIFFRGLRPLDPHLFEFEGPRFSHLRIILRIAP